MDNTSECIYYGALTFITILILDFIAIEMVLKLGVFSIGNIYVRIAILVALEVHAISMFIFDITGEKNFLYLQILIICWWIWNPLYFYMLIEQNVYWMEAKVRKILLCIFAFVSFLVTLITIVFLLVTFGILPPTTIEYDQYLDTLLLAIISIAELWVVFKIYQMCKSKLATDSPKLFKRVKFSIFVCIFCVFLDIGVIVWENYGYANFSYLFKPISFAFKVVFECLCFQFIKGIVVSINQVQ